MFKNWFSNPSGRGPIRWGQINSVDGQLATLHFLAAGSTGSGKTSLIRRLLHGVLKDVKTPAFDTRFLIYDAKADAYSDIAALGLQSHTIILNPFDSRCHCWDIGADIQDDVQAQELAAIIIPPGEGQNKYFYDAARLLLGNAVLALIKMRGRNWDLRDLLLLCGNVDDLKLLIERAKLPTSEIRDFLRTGSDDREARSVRMTLAVELNDYKVIAGAWHQARLMNRSFSIQDWVAGRGQQILLLGASKDARKALATVNRLVLQRTQQFLLGFREKSERTGRRTWVILDEFPTLATIPHLEEFLTEGRSRGVCCVLGFQHIDQVRHWYKDLSNALLGQCFHQAFFRANDPIMAQWCADHFGLYITREDPNSFHGHHRSSPELTMNNFLFLPPANRSEGFQCHIRSCATERPGINKVPACSELDQADELSTSEKENEARFIPWKVTPEFKAWALAEREEYDLPPTCAEKISVSVNLSRNQQERIESIASTFSQTVPVYIEGLIERLYPSTSETAGTNAGSESS